MEILTKSTASRLDKVRLVGAGTNEILHISDAVGRAEDKGLDLVLVSEDVTPPVVRIQDFKKIAYEKKKAKKSSNTKQGTLKELKFTINISQHDLATKVGKIEKFLEKGDKVKIVVRLKGRERESPQTALQLLDKIGSLVPCRYTRASTHSSNSMYSSLMEPLSTAKDSSKKKSK